MKVYLTPAYSLDKPRVYTGKVEVNRTGDPLANKSYLALTRGKYLNLVGNNNELVPREEQQMVIHYLPPPGHEEGYLVLAFNEKTSLKKSFRYVSERMYYGETEVEDLLDEPAIQTNPAYQAFIQSQTAGFQDIHAFAYGRQAIGGARRLFVSLKIESPRIGTEIAIKVFFVPKKGLLPSPEISSTRKLMILASHDPNRITVAPRTIEYPMPGDTVFRYILFFQNKGEGDANAVSVRINRDPTLDPERLEIDEARIAGEICPLCTEVDNPRQSCLAVEVNETSIDFEFRNVILSGTKGKDVPDNSFTKGEIRFRMRPMLIPGEKGARIPDVDAILVRGAIKFDTEADTIFTNEIDTRFRVRSMGARIGYNYGSPLSELKGRSQGLSNLVLGISYVDNPVFKGLAWESELSFSSFRYERQKALLFVQPGLLGRNDSLLTNLNVRLYYLDILAQSRYHFSEYIGIGFGAGFSTLITGSGQSEVTLRKDRLDESLSQEIQIGLSHLGKTSENLTFANGEVYEPDVRNDPGSFLGMTLFADLGVGKINRGPMLGIRYGTRFQNGLFDFSFARQVYLQLYFQWKL